MYVAIILENFSEAKEDVKHGFSDDDINLYNEIWYKFDPKFTEFISFEKLSDFVDSLEESPLRIPEPNRDKLILMDISLYENNLVNYADVFDALVKNYIGFNGELGTENVKEITKTLPKKFQKKNYNSVSSTLKMFATEKL